MHHDDATRRARRHGSLFAVHLTDVDAKRIALSGWSFGGYLGLRGALDPRLAGCVLDPGLVGLRQPVRAMLKDLPADALRQSCRRGA
jgi:cephalosporin-C deacetylase-like acetyl esterase